MNKNLSDFYSKNFLDFSFFFFFLFVWLENLFLFFCVAVINLFHLILVLALLSKTPKIRLQKFFNFFLDLILDEEKLKNYWNEREEEKKRGKG